MKTYVAQCEKSFQGNINRKVMKMTNLKKNVLQVLKLPITFSIREWKAQLKKIEQLKPHTSELADPQLVDLLRRLTKY